MGHDVGRFAADLSAKLASHSRHVCFLLGAGASRASGLPDIAALTGAVLNGLEGEQRDAFQALTAARSLEAALSRIRRIAALVENDDEIDGLTADQAHDLDRTVCRLIVQALVAAPVDTAAADGFARWIERTDYTRPVEIFTINYDLLIEDALERLGVPYFDGFVGTYRAKFRTDLVEAGPKDQDLWLPNFIPRLWKLHGSITWTWATELKTEVVRHGTAVPDQVGPAAIYPSDEKYDESRRMPFLVLQDRFRRALLEPETLTVIAGYSWGDAHLNELVFEAAQRRPRSEVLALNFGDIPEELARAATQIPNLQTTAPHEAIIGTVRDMWSGPVDGLPASLWSHDRFALGDFAAFSSYLARTVAPQQVAAAGTDA